MLIGIFWSRLGTPTSKEQSGTIHEIKEFIKRKGPDRVKLFFSERDVPHSIPTQDLEAVRRFKGDMQREGLYCSYTDPNDFAAKLRHQLDITVARLLETEEAKTKWSEKAHVTEQDKLMLEISRSQHEFLQAATNQFLK